MNNKIIDIVTDKVIKSLESGQLPAWRKEWVSGLPRNYVTNKVYKGFNLMLLGYSDFTSPYWLTYKQATEQGGYVKKGEHGTIILFWSIVDKSKKNIEDNTKTAKGFPLLRYYKVFNYEQTEGVPCKDVKKDNNPIAECVRIVEGYQDKPEIVNSNNAWYKKSNDTIGMPTIESFNNSESYYATLFHEMTHSTGAEKRLNRKELANAESFGSELYSFEELIAEFGSATLCGTAGISNAVVDNQSAYIAGWLRSLKNDKSMLIKAGSQSTKAVQFILGEGEE